MFHVERFLDILEKWNKKINLVKYNSRDELLRRHVDDSRQLTRYIDAGNRIIDIGSGGGFPGVILGLLGYEISLVESDERKCAFLRYVIQRLELDRLRLINDRVEKLKLECDVLVCRAFGDLRTIFKLTSSIEVKEKYLLLKGKSCMQEIAAAEKEWLFRYVVHDSISSHEGKILEIYDLRRNGN